MNIPDVKPSASFETHKTIFSGIGRLQKRAGQQTDLISITIVIVA